MIGSAHTSAMLLPRTAALPLSGPPIVTAIETGLRRVPWQAGHGTSRMKPSNRSRLVSLSASPCRRSM